MAYTENEIMNLVSGSEVTGQSTYDLWKSLGYEGTAEDFLNYLKDDGESNVSEEVFAQIEQNKNDISQLQETKVDKPSTATVGQILAVKAVDENGKPTEFEAINKPTSGSTSGNIEVVGNGYNYEYIGCPFPALDDYQSWPIAGVQYDKTRNKIMCLVTDADVHVDATRFRLRLFALDAVTGEAELIQTLRDNTVEPVINIHSAFGSQRGFLIDNDTGIYYKFHYGGTPYACKSSDGGVTWENIEITPTNSNSILFGSGNGQIIKTSSGRIICGLFCNGFAYTDDYFQTLTYVTSGKYSVDGVASAHEYEIIEYETGKLVAIMRKTWQSRTGEVWSGTKRIEPALLSFSDDNGTTWSYPVESKSITNMSATNCCSFIHGDSLELYVGCRYPIFADKVSAMFRYTAKLEDIKIDNFKFEETMFYGATSEFINFGNLAGCKDSVGNYHLFYNDAGDNNSCRWHYIKVCKTTDNNSKVQEVPNNKEIQTYNATVIDILLNAIYKHVDNVKKELLLKLGELPESGDLLNPEYWVTDGLAILYKIDEEYYDATTGMISPLYASDSYKEVKMQSYKGEYDGSVPETINKTLLKMNKGSSGVTSFFKDLLINSEKGYTIEIDFTSTPFHPSGDHNVRLLNNNLTKAWEAKTLSAWSTSDYTTSDVKDVGGGFDTSRLVNTFTWLFDKANKRVVTYINGVEKGNSDGVEIAENYTLDFAEAFNASSQIGDFWTRNRNGDLFNSFAGSKSHIRFYNRALTAEEVNANAIFSNK